MNLKEVFWRGRGVLVTGGSGFIGSWLVKELLELGADVTCLIREEGPRTVFWSEGLDKKCSIVRGSLEDTLLMERVLAEYEPDTVFHLGAQTQVTIANKYPYSTFESNVRGTYSLLDAARRNGGGTKIIVASSDKAYGSNERLPYREDFPLQGVNPYDVSKSCVDLVSQSYAKVYGMPIAISRCANFFGGGDLNFKRIVPGTIRSILRGERPVIRSDGKFVRDYVYVKDAVSTYLLLREKMEKTKLNGEAFNFSTENQKTVLELVELMLKLMKSKLRPEIQNKASNEIRKQHLSCEKARRMLGWKPEYSLEGGLVETIDWYKKFFGGKK